MNKFCSKYKRQSSSFHSQQLILLFPLMSLKLKMKKKRLENFKEKEKDLQNMTLLPQLRVTTAMK